MSQQPHERRASAWHDAGHQWKQGGLITAGVDLGLATSKSAVAADGKLIAYSSLWNGVDSPAGAEAALDAALDGTGLSKGDIGFIVATGCRADEVANAGRTVSEIACHARGAGRFMGPSLGTVLVMGGRDCVAIGCTGEGSVASFLTNACPPSNCRKNLCNACGAAQGQAIEAVAEVLDVPIEEVGPMSLSANEAELTKRLALPFDDRGRIHDQLLEEIAEEVVLQGGASPLSGALGVVCAVLAKSMATGLLRNGWSKAEILAAYCAALAHQAAMLARRLGIKEMLVVTGGVAKNVGVVKRLEAELGGKPVVMQPDPQIAAALGAALYAQDFAQKARSTS